MAACATVCEHRTHEHGSSGQAGDRSEARKNTERKDTRRSQEPERGGQKRGKRIPRAREREREKERERERERERESWVLLDSSSPEPPLPSFRSTAQAEDSSAPDGARRADLGAAGTHLGLSMDLPLPQEKEREI